MASGTREESDKYMWKGEGEGGRQTGREELRKEQRERRMEGA